MSPRKRRRDQAFPEEGAESQTVPNDEEDLALSEQQRAEKEQEVWEAIREAHYEAVEQLPLTLQRQLSLMRQLDEQSITINHRLLPTLQTYIKQREEMAANSENQPAPVDEQVVTADHGETTEPSPSVQLNGLTNRKHASLVDTPSKWLRQPESGHSPRTQTPGSVPPEASRPPETTRELLSYVARMSDELLRASQEKVNLAQANHDSVERHIRLLDQAIKEQESSITLDQSRSSTGVAIHLPELVAPEWPRKSRNNRPPDDVLDTMNGDEHVFFTEMQAEPSKVSQRASRKKGKDKQGFGQIEGPRDSSSLTITLPAVAQQDEELAMQPHEEVYCYCSRVSFGQMIACDNDSCEREWFHLGCVGLTEIPEGEWYCEDCRGPGDEM